MRDGRVVLAGAFVRDRWADSGSSSHGYITDEIPGSIDVKLLCELVERIGYFGPFSAEYGIAGGQAFFFEINLRNDGTSHYFFQAGANIPLAYVASCAGLDYSAIQTKVDRKSYFIDELFDYENVILGRVAKHEWQRDFSTATVYKYYDSVDVEPFLLAKKGRTRQIVQDLVLKRFRLYIVFVMDKIGMGK